MSQPNISFFVSHRPSSFFSFFSEMGSPPLWLVIFGGGNIECMPCSMALESLAIFCVVLSFVAAMKSSTYTSMVLILFAGVGSEFAQVVLL